MYTGGMGARITAAPGEQQRKAKQVQAGGKDVGRYQRGLCCCPWWGGNVLQLNDISHVVP